MLGLLWHCPCAAQGMLLAVGKNVAVVFGGPCCRAAPTL